MTERFETFVLSINRIYRAVQRIKTREMTELGLSLEEYVDWLSAQ